MLASPADPTMPMTPCITDDWLYAAAHEVRDRCLCLHLQAAARAVGRRFDAALKPLGLTGDAYCLLALLSRPRPLSLDEVRQFLVMDDAVLSAVMEPLLRRRLLAVVLDPSDERACRLELTAAGTVVLAQALTVWRGVHESLATLLAGSSADALRGDLLALAFGEP